MFKSIRRFATILALLFLTTGYALAGDKDFSIVVGTNIYNDGAQKAVDDVAVAMIHQWLPGK